MAKSRAKKMDDTDLLNQLQLLEQEAAVFTNGKLSTSREEGMREYYRMPYGNEQEGLSSLVTSEVQDTVEWMLPSLLDVFVSNDEAVVFEPTQAQDVDGAKQATDTCNYVFYQQNNGFLVLYTAFKDALMVKNCAVMWRVENRRTKNVIPVKGATDEMLAMIMRDAGEDAHIESASKVPGQPMMEMGPDGMPAPVIDPNTGQPVMGPELYNARVCTYEDRKCIKVEAFPPETLYVKRDWTSPMLQDCPYVSRNMLVTLSELHEMGFEDVTADDLAGSDDVGIVGEATVRRIRSTNDDSLANEQNRLDNEDESQTQGYLRIEFVLVDYDGDGVAERRCVYRLKDKILSNEECDHVPIATTSPVLVQHRWDGMSVAEMVSDLQRLRTDMTRQMVDSGRLALTPRTKVLTDSSWSPQANIDDLLDPRPGGIIRQLVPNATQEVVTPWVGAQMFQMFDYLDNVLSKRTGVTGQSQGLDANSLNRGGAYENRVMNESQRRVKLIARIFAETLVKPIFQGILKLLTDGDMERVAFRLRGEFVEYDPNEWRDHYDMTINVGLGTGDRAYQTAVLQQVSQQQAGIAMSPFGKLLITPKQVYNTQAKLLEFAGFKNVSDYYTDPGDKLPQVAPPPMPPQVQIKQMELAADAQKFQAESQLAKEVELLKHELSVRETQGQLELQASNDARDAERERLSAIHKAEMEAMRIQLERYKVDADNQTRITVAQISHQKDEGANDGGVAVSEVIAQLHSMPKNFEVVRDSAGRIVKMTSRPAATPNSDSGEVNAAIKIAAKPVDYHVKRDEMGRMTGIETGKNEQTQTGM